MLDDQQHNREQLSGWATAQVHGAVRVPCLTLDRRATREAGMIMRYGAFLLRWWRRDSGTEPSKIEYVQIAHNGVYTTPRGVLAAGHRWQSVHLLEPSRHGTSPYKRSRMGIAEQQSKLEDAKIQAFAGHTPGSVPPVALAGLAKQAALWLLPFGCVAVVSGTIAYVGEQAFERNSSDRYGAREFAAASTVSQPRTATQVTDIQLEEVLRAPEDTVLAWRWASPESLAGRR